MAEAVTKRVLIPCWQAESYRQGRVLLAGDAAHCHSPVGGRGMNLGMAAAAAAASAIAAGAVEDYSAARHAIGRKILKQTEFARRTVLSENAGPRAAALAVGKPIMAVPMLQRLKMKYLSQF